MKLAMQIGYSGGFEASVAQVQALEKAGMDIAYVAEAYGYDGVSLMGYLAAKTETVQIAAGILPIYTRTPTLLAMTAAGVDDLSKGRCILGLGASGPQVIEGFHGVPYDAPIGRTREIIQICRQVWARKEPVVHDGRYYQLPLSEDQGTGLGKPLKIITKPLRPNIPIHVAALGPKNVSMTAEIADGWFPLYYSPWRQDVYADQLLAIGGGAGAVRDFARPMVALYVGGMGARDKNFYNNLFQRYGYEDAAAEIQNLYLDGKKQEAGAAVPDSFLAETSLAGDEGFVREQIQRYADSGVTVLNVTPIAADLDGQARLIEKVKGWIG